MALYNSGSVNIVIGSANVRGNSTDFITYTTQGNLFKLNEDNSFYEIGSVVNATNFTLTSRYADTSYQTARSENVASANTATKTYSDTLSNTPLIQNYVVITASERFTDNGSGVLAGNDSPAGSGTVDYDSGLFSITLGNDLTGSVNLVASYYSGDTRSSMPYKIVTDFTPNYDLPELSLNDREFNRIFTKAMRLIDTELNDLDTKKAIVGANSDITSMTGLSNDGIPLTKVANAASDGANSDITSMTGLSTGGIPLQAIASTYGVSWDEDADTYSRTGSLTGESTSQTLAAALLPIQSAMRRCVINDAGEVQYYLGATDSYNREFQNPSITGTDDAGAASKVSDAVLATGTDDVGTASKVSDVGVFTAAEAVYLDMYVHNTTDDTYARIVGKDSNDVLSISADIMDIGETFNIGVLSNPAADYVGHYVHNTTDDTYAMITAKDSDAALSIDADILDSAEAYEICTAILDGTDGHQVMTQIPKFYYKYGYSGTTHTWEISQLPQSGFSVHPAFIKNGVVVDYRYMGAYEGIAWDNNISAYIDGVGFAGDTGADKLSSVSGFAPWTDETRAQFRTFASNRGTGWRQQDYDLSSAIQLLYLVEYADWNSQSMIGMGRTELSGGTWVKDSYIGVTGKSNGDGNGTNSVSIGTDQGFLTDYMTYRGIENFFGNIWKFVDGININDSVPYVSNTDTDFADNTAIDYTDLGITLPNTNGYQKTLEQQSRGFLPASVGGTGVGSSTYITDYYYQDIDWRVIRLGGGASSGVAAGVACWNALSASSNANVYVGARLTY